VRARGTTIRAQATNASDAKRDIDEQKRAAEERLQKEKRDAEERLKKG